MKNAWQYAGTSWIEPKRAGNVGRYLSVLNCASENGLSFETYGRACVFVTPRSASKRATGLDVIADSCFLEGLRMSPTQEEQLVLSGYVKMLAAGILISELRGLKQGGGYVT